MPAEAISNEEKTVVTIYDNRENKKNFATFKPHYLLVFADETADQKSRAKIQGENMELLRSRIAGKNAAGNFGKYLFTIERGEYEGKEWAKIQDVMPPMGSQGPGTPVKQETEHAHKSPAPEPAAKGASSLVASSFIPNTPNFFNRLGFIKDLAISDAQAINLAVERYHNIQAPMFRDAEDEKGMEPHPDFVQIVDQFTIMIRTRRIDAQVTYYKDLIDRCQTKPDLLVLADAIETDFVLDRKNRDGLAGIIKILYEKPLTGKF